MRAEVVKGLLQKIGEDKVGVGLVDKLDKRLNLAKTSEPKVGGEKNIEEQLQELIKDSSDDDIKKVLMALILLYTKNCSWVGEEKQIIKLLIKTLTEREASDIIIKEGNMQDYELTLRFLVQTQTYFQEVQDIVLFLIKNQVSVDTQSSSKTLLLNDLINRNKIAEAKFIIEQGGRVDITDRSGQTPLSIIIKENYLELLDVFMKREGKNDTVFQYIESLTTNTKPLQPQDFQNIIAKLNEVIKAMQNFQFVEDKTDDENLKRAFIKKQLTELKKLMEPISKMGKVRHDWITFSREIDEIIKDESSELTGTTENSTICHHVGKVLDRILQAIHNVLLVRGKGEASQGYKELVDNSRKIGKNEPLTR